MNVGFAKKKYVRAPHLGPERRRPQILDAALKLAAEDGVHAVNMEAVAQALSVTKPVVYACFCSREDLLNALLAREELRLFEGVMAALPTKVDLSNPEQLMTDGFRALFRAVDNHRDSWRLVLSAGADPDVGARLQEGRRLVALRVSKLVGGWLKLRGARDAKRRLPILVSMFMSVCEGMVHSLLDGTHDWTIDELGAYVGRRVLAAFEHA
ncbi:MAG: TetR/AcrR family transcriptional regulator [Stenotrophobium sp.]